MKEVLNAAPKIISTAAKSPAGVISLMMLALSVLGYVFFSGASEAARISMFVLMFVGYFVLAMAVLGRSAALSRKAEARPPTLNAPPEMKSQNLVPTRVAFKRLLFIWLFGSLPIFFVLVVQVVLGKFADTEESLVDLWAWLAPAIIPPSSVVVIGLACSYWDRRQRVRPLLTVCCTISVVYLILAFGTILVEPFTMLGELRLLKLSTLVVAPLEGILVALLAVLLAWAPNEISIR